MKAYKEFNMVDKVDQARETAKARGFKDIVASVPATFYVDLICKYNGRGCIARVYDDGQIEMS